MARTVIRHYQTKKRNRAVKLIIVFALVVAAGVGLTVAINIKTKPAPQNPHYSNFTISSVATSLDNSEPAVKPAPPENLYDKYHEKNSDTVAAIKIEGTNIDYPVMQTDTEDEYLYTDIDGNYDIHGLPYLQQGCSVDGSTNLIIYGHNSSNGTMFNNLRKFIKPDFWKNATTVSLYLPEGRQDWTIFAVCIIPVNDDGFIYNQYGRFEDAEQARYYIDKISTYALYDTNIRPSTDEPLLILSTCEQSRTTDKRLVIFAKRS